MKYSEKVINEEVNEHKAKVRNKHKKLSGQITELKLKADKYFNAVLKRNQKISLLEKAVENLEAKEKDSHARIEKLSYYEEQHSGLIACITKERQNVTDRDNLINELIRKVSEIDGNPDVLRKKFMDLRSNTGTVKCEKTTEKSDMND